jgi:flavin reductase (DIM6/NTAB) family NADH-FMN oxidoreductase RutF
VSWVTITSWEPFLMAVSVAPGRYTHECIEFCREFVINYPGEEIAKQAWVCSTQSGRKKDKLAGLQIPVVVSKKVKPPTIESSTVAFECQVVGKAPTGDHTLFIGNVVAISGNKKAMKHIYCVNYGKLVSCDCEGNVNFNLEYI